MTDKPEVGKIEFDNFRMGLDIIKMSIKIEDILKRLDKLEQAQKRREKK